MTSFRLPDFTAATRGFAFPNSFPRGTPVVKFGPLKFGDATFGLCGGMVFAAVDFYLRNRKIAAAEAEPELVRLFSRRLLDSWAFPFGWSRYYLWQIWPSATVYHNGVRVLDGVVRWTRLQEWPSIRAELDAGRPAPLGLVKEKGFDPRKLNRNHQVLAYGYDLVDSTVELAVYDPNYPADESLRLIFSLANPDVDEPVIHTAEGPSIRGIFLTDYRT